MNTNLSFKFKVFLFVLLGALLNLIFVVKLFGQNLVPNPSFEDTIYCPSNNSQMDAVMNWDRPPVVNINSSTSDYYNTCNYMLSAPHTGDAYCGFITYLNFYPNAREYLQVKMLSSLDAGKCYKAEMWLALRNGSGYTNSDVGMYFSQTAPQVPNILVINAQPQLYSSPSEMSNDTSWTKIVGTFVASGGEEYLTIGVFVPDLSMTINNLSTGGIGSYYFVDDVSLTAVPDSFTNFEIGQDTTICSTENITISVGSSYNSYRWVELNNQTNTLSTGPSVVVSPTASTSYILFAEDASSCPHVISVDTITISVALPPPTSVQTTICDGESILLGGDFQDQAGTYFDTLLTLGNCDSVIITNLSVLPKASATFNVSICEGESHFAGGALQTNTGTYYDTLMALNNCDSIITTNLMVIPKQTTNLSQTICSNDSIFVGGDFQDQAGTYYDTLTTDNGCDSIIITAVTITAAPTLWTTSDTSLLSGDNIVLQANGALSYLWSTGAGGNSITVSPSQTTTYIVTGTDSFGCTSTAEIIISIIAPYNVFVPNIFSQSSLNNDNSRLHVFGAGVASLDFKIFDRWGELVYETADNTSTIRNDGLCCRYGDGWDGSLLGGETPLNNTSFAYIIKGNYTNGEAFFESGSILMINNKQ